MPTPPERPTPSSPRSAWPPPGPDADSEALASVWPPPGSLGVPTVGRYPTGPDEGIGERGGLDRDRSSAPDEGAEASLASWWQRVGAMVLDSLILAVPLWIFLVAFVLSSPPHSTHGKLGAGDGGTVALSYLVVIVVEGAYFSLLNGLGRGQTLGDRAPGIAVRDARTGAPIGPWRGLLRWLVRFVLYVVFVVPGVVNDLFPLWDPQRQTLADKAARSVVVRLR